MALPLFDTLSWLYPDDLSTSHDNPLRYI